MMFASLGLIKEVKEILDAYIFCLSIVYNSILWIVVKKT